MTGAGSQVLVRGGQLVGTNTQVDFVLLDSSSSMLGKWWQTLDAIDTYIQGMRAAHVSSHFLLAAFSSHDLQYMWRDSLLADASLMRDNPPGAHGGKTPLYDAINLMARRLRELDPKQASVLVVTDGEENDSRFTTLAQARSLLDWMRLRGWQVTFIGCDFDNTALGRSLGASAGAMLGTSARRLGEVTRLLAEKRARYGRTGDGIEFSEEERQRFGGYLGARGTGAEHVN
jgi:hypothetical protein